MISVLIPGLDVPILSLLMNDRRKGLACPHDPDMRAASQFCTSLSVHDHLVGGAEQARPILRGGAPMADFVPALAGVLPGPGMARINRATCSGSSSWTKCRAPGI